MKAIQSLVKGQRVNYPSSWTLILKIRNSWLQHLLCDDLGAPDRWCRPSCWMWSQRKLCLSTWLANQRFLVRRGSRSHHEPLQGTNPRACVTLRYVHSSSQKHSNYSVTKGGQGSCISALVRGVDACFSSSGGDSSGGAVSWGSGQSSLWLLGLRFGALLLWAVWRGNQRQTAQLSGSTLHCIPAALQRLHSG